MKVQSKYKVPKITAAKKTDQLADAQTGEPNVTMKVKGYGEMQFKFFMKKAPLAVKNFVTLVASVEKDVADVGQNAADFFTLTVTRLTLLTI